MFYISLLFLLSLFWCPVNLIAMSSSSSDVAALLSFKSLITHDPYEALSSWEWGGGNHSLHFCQWRGVTCNIKHRGQLRVTALDLEALDLGGPISPSLSNLTLLQRLHLPENQLSGPIPEELGLLSNLRHLNLSFNLLQGLTLLMIMLVFGFTKWRRKLTGSPSTGVQTVDQHMRISYAELLKATDQFSIDNLIGKGSHGYVYRGNLMDSDEHKVIAVKVLNLHKNGASKSFDAECKVLRNIRHRNLVNVLTSCSSTNYKGDDFKALVYEFMPNGSLENWLHPQINNQSSIRKLSLLQRMSISIDVAFALDYLHHRGQFPIVHCDLKPSNVLLDDDMTAHVGDFGLARLLVEPTSESIQTSASSAALKGTIGYVAPEYGVSSKISTEGDVYSYGIMLLEMFTGRRPTEEIFKEGLSLHRFVEMALPNMIADVLDPMLYSTQEYVEAATFVIVQRSNLSRHDMECIVSFLNIGLSCSKDSPIERMKMSHALNDLQTIRNVFLIATNA